MMGTRMTLRICTGSLPGRLLLVAAAARAAGIAPHSSAGCCARRAAGDHGAHADAHPACADDLNGLEVHERLAIRQDGPQLVVARVGEIALRLDDLEVRRHADLELALRGLEPF